MSDSKEVPESSLFDDIRIMIFHEKDTVKRAEKRSRYDDMLKQHADKRRAQCTQLMRALCDYLQWTGIDATLLDPESPDALPPGEFFSGNILGWIKVEGQNFDLILLQEYADYVNREYQYDYTVRLNVKGLEKKLKVQLYRSLTDRDLWHGV